MKFSDSSEITFVLTSCGRFDLLRRTLESFNRFNTASIFQAIIIEDSGNPGVSACLPQSWREQTTVIVNDPKIGQLASIDTAYSLVTTPWIFHCEDDWEFYRPGFIEDSMKLLAANPEAIQVWLRSYAHDLHVHSPYIDIGPRLTHDGVFYYRVYSSNPDWQGFSFNPGLRRIKDYFDHSPYSQKGSEKALSKLYAADQRYALILENDAVLHTGFANHVVRDRDRENKQRKKRYEKIRISVAFLLGLVLATLTHAIWRVTLS